MHLGFEKDEWNNNSKLSCNSVTIGGGYWSRHIDATGSAYHVNEVNSRISYPPTNRGEEGLVATHLAAIVKKIIAILLNTIPNHSVE